MATNGKAKPKLDSKVTLEKLEKYWALSEKALKMAMDAVDSSKKKEAEDFLNMTSCYLSDSKHFAKQGNYVTAFGAVNYAHAWLDAGARIGLFKVRDSSLFTVDD
ncbi:MAG: DUF357 domain-containing protein [Candidatus Woesearchaeota archaeon]